jgi:hypothetical protein
MITLAAIKALPFPMGRFPPTVPGARLAASKSHSQTAKQFFR